jgi:cellulose synthase operon protein C
MISLEPSAPEGYALRALSNLNRKRYAESEADVRKAVAIAPDNAFGYVQLGNLKFVQKQYIEALKAYRAGLERNPNSTDSLRGLMSAYVGLKQSDEAIAAANAQIAKFPNNGSFYDLLGTTLFLDKKDLSGAESAFEKATALDPHNLDARLKLCQVQATKGDIDQAIATLQKAIKDNSHETSFYFLLGKLYEAKSDWKQAEDAYKSALAINPDHPLASNNLAKLMAQTGGNLDVALSLAQTARRVLPESPSVADTLAWIDYQKGAYQSAIGLLLEALKLQQKTGTPDDSDIHYHLGMAYLKNGQNVLARQQLERALKLNPNSSAAKKELEQLKSS